jgi:hypothetical protein
MVRRMMVDENPISGWRAAFPDFPELEPEHRVAMLENSAFNQLKRGEPCRGSIEVRDPGAYELRRRRQCGMIAD